MVKCSKAEVRRLKTALRWQLPPVQRERIQMVLLRESGMMQVEIAQCMGVSLSTVNRAHMAYDHGGIKALKPKPNGGRKHENMTLAQEKALLARYTHQLNSQEDRLNLLHREITELEQKQAAEQQKLEDMVQHITL